MVTFGAAAKSDPRPQARNSSCAAGGNKKWVAPERESFYAAGGNGKRRLPNREKATAERWLLFVRPHGPRIIRMTHLYILEQKRQRSEKEVNSTFRTNQNAAASGGSKSKNHGFLAAFFPPFLPAAYTERLRAPARLTFALGGAGAVPRLRARVTFGPSPKSDQKGCLKPQVSRLPARLRKLLLRGVSLALRARWQQRLNVALTFFYPRCRSCGKICRCILLKAFAAQQAAPTLAACGGKCAI